MFFSKENANTFCFVSYVIFCNQSLHIASCTHCAGLNLYKDDDDDDDAYRNNAHKNRTLNCCLHARFDRRLRQVRRRVDSKVATRLVLALIALPQLGASRSIALTTITPFAVAERCCSLDVWLGYSRAGHGQLPPVSLAGGPVADPV